MMDFHIFIVIACVFLASLCSLLFINKFFRRKTFEEIIAEKKAMTEKIYGQTKAAAKKPKKLQQLKKEAKREKKQRQKERLASTTEHEEDSDAQSETAADVAEEESPPPGLSKIHVEFEPEPEVVTYNAAETVPVRRASNAEKENIAAADKKPKSKKDKKDKRSGILLNKNEPVAIKENPVSEEPLNHFDVKPPKDVVELKKQEKEKREDKKEKKEKVGPKKASEKSVPTAAATEPQIPAEAEQIQAPATKEVRQLEEKVRQSTSPKQQAAAQPAQANKSAKQPSKKQLKETAATKELVLALDRLSESDTVGVSLLMNLFRRASLNRSEIQILIDYLLNRQQDMPASHSEWSDDICQKLKRQLEEKERLLTEEQEASIGIQAKLRELRTEVNSERAQMNATVKAYIEKLQSKDQELTSLNQELQALNEKIALERQQFQAKLLREKQAGSQDLLAQLQRMQQELAHKDKCIAELTCMVNASRQAVEESAQKNEIIQQQAQQIQILEQQRDELEQVSNNRIFELEQAKTLETECAESKVEIRNLQNAFESFKADMAQTCQELESAKTDLAHARDIALDEKQKEIQQLQAQRDELLAGVSNNAADTVKEKQQSDRLQSSLETVSQQLTEKERQLADFGASNAQLTQQLANAEASAKQQAQQQQELQQLVANLKQDVANKQQQLQLAEHKATEQDAASSREQELLQQLQEQREKNNQQEQLLTAAATQKSVTASVSTDPTAKDQKQIRELFQRLYPEAEKACAGTALSLPFEQWVEQVLATHVKQAISKSSTSSNSSKSTQSNSTDSGGDSSGHKNPQIHNSHNNNINLLNSESTNNSNSRTTNSSSSSPDTGTAIEVEQKLHTQNAQLRAKIDELTNLVTKTSNTLSELENRAREQDEHWRSIVRSKDEQIYSLQHSNGEENI